MAKVFMTCARFLLKVAFKRKLSSVSLPLANCWTPDCGNDLECTSEYEPQPSTAHRPSLITDHGHQH